MGTKYIVNCWSVFLYHDIYTRAKLIHFKRGLVAWGGFVAGGFCLYTTGSTAERQTSGLYTALQVLRQATAS